MITLAEPAPAAPPELDPSLARNVGEFLAAWSAIERWGVEGWLRLDPEAARLGPHPDLMACLGVFCGELQRLENERDIAEAADRRERQRRAEQSRR